MICASCCAWRVAGRQTRASAGDSTWSVTAPWTSRPLPRYPHQRGVDLPGIGWIVGIYGFTWGAAQFLSGKMSDHLGRQRLNVWGMWICGAGVAAFPLGTGSAWWSMAAAVTGSGMAMLYPNLSVAVAMFASGAVLHAFGEETHPGLNPAS